MLHTRGVVDDTAVLCFAEPLVELRVPSHCNFTKCAVFGFHLVGLNSSVEDAHVELKGKGGGRAGGVGGGGESS
jgi:hypothetical protein